MTASVLDWETATALQPAVGLRPAPVSDPPYDDAGAGAENTPLATPGLAVALPGLDRTVWPPAGHQSVPAPAHLPSTPVSSAPAAAPPGPRAIVLVRALLEVLAGARSPAQLNGWVTPSLALDLDQRRRPGAPGRPATLLSVRLSEPREGVAEVSAVLRRPGAHGRAGALALRMDCTEGRWVVSRLAVG